MFIIIIIIVNINFIFFFLVIKVLRSHLVEYQAVNSEKDIVNQAESWRYSSLCRNSGIGSDGGKYPTSEPIH